MKIGDRVEIVTGGDILFGTGCSEWGTVISFKKGWFSYHWIVALDNGDIVKV